MNPPPPRRGADVTLGPGKYQKYRRAARVGILADPTFLARTPTTFYSSLTRAFVRLYRAATYFASTLRSLREEMETSTALARARPRFNAALTCRRDETRDGGRRRVTAQEERRGHDSLSLSLSFTAALEKNRREIRTARCPPTMYPPLEDTSSRCHLSSRLLTREKERDKGQLAGRGQNSGIG